MATIPSKFFPHTRDKPMQVISLYPLLIMPVMERRNHSWELSFSSTHPWWCYTMKPLTYCYLITPVMVVPRSYITPHACDKMKNKSGSFSTPVRKKKAKLNGDYGHGHARDQANGSGHAYLHARGQCSKTLSFVLPSLIVHICNNMLYMYKYTSYMMCNT